MGGIIAVPPLGEATFRAGQVPTEVLDLVVGKRVVEGLVTTGCGALGHGRSLGKRRVPCAEFVLRSAGVVLDVMPHVR
jgi:hypothetical protein